MLITRHDLEIFTPPCSPGSTRFSAYAHLDVDIREVLPYLNTTLDGAAYFPEAPALTWQDGAHYVAFNVRQIAVGGLEDRTEAEAVVARLIDLVNQTWAQRDTITPDTSGHKRAAPMAVFTLLPRTNCRLCGQPTCFTFALKLVAGEAVPADCPPLDDPAFAGQRAQLIDLLPGAV